VGLTPVGFIQIPPGAKPGLDHADSCRTEWPLPGMPDVVMHDNDSQRLYVAIGDPGVVHPVARRLFAFCPASCGAALYAER